MDPQSIFLAAKPRVRRKRKQGATSEPAPPVALTLVAATYDEFVPSVTLAFDRPIDIAGLDGSSILVRDGDAAQMMWSATGAAVQDATNTVRITLEPVEGDSTPGVMMNAGPTNGIVAVDDGGEWGGASELALPFP
jgi:hypothetical protein